MKFHKSALTIVFLLLLTRTVYANAVSDPAYSLEMTLQRISLFQKSNQQHNRALLRIFIEQEILPRFSFTALTQGVIRPYARYMNPAEKTAFQTRIKTDFQNMLIQHLGNFDPQRTPVRIENTGNTQAKFATVSVHVYLHGQIPLALNFRMLLVQQQWKIADIQSNGLSLVMYYRAHFHEQLQAYRLQPDGDMHATSPG